MKNWLDYKFLSLLLLNGLVLMILFLTYNRPQFKQECSQQFEVLNQKINQLQQQSPVNVDLAPLKQDVDDLRALLHQLQNKTDKQFDDGQSQLQRKLNSIQHVLQTLDEKQHLVKYLPVSALPFKVLSIDSIQQINVVSVSYDFKTIPLEKNDTLVGWTVTRLDFGKQRAEFENGNKDHVVITLGEKHA